MKTKKVLVVGYYGDGNTGDEAILTSMLRDLRAAQNNLDFTVPAYGPGAAGLEERHGVRSFHFQDMTRMLDAVESADLVLVGGGGLLHDLWPPEPERMLTSEHWGLNYYCGIPWLAAGMGKNVMIYAAGVGPLVFAEGRDLVRDLAHAARAITLRDEASAALLEELSSEMPPPEVTADPVWRLDPLEGAARAKFLERAGVPSGPWLGVAARNWSVGVDQESWERELVAGVREFASRRGLGVLFLPFQQANTPLQDDVGLARRIAARMPELKTHVLEDPCTPEELGGAIGACDVLLGMRLHSIVLACMTGTPAAALDYDPKVELHRSMLEPPLPSVRLAGLTAASLVGALESAWEAREEMPARQRELAARMRERAARNVEAALEVLDMAPRAPAPEAGRTFEAIRKAEELKETGVFVPARVGGGPSPRLSPAGRGSGGGSRKVRIVTSTFFNPEGNDMAYGGAERYLLELARLVRELGYEVEVFQRAEKKDWVRYYRETRVLGVVPEKDPFLLDSAIRRISPNDPALTIYLAFYLGGEASPDSIGISHCVYWDDDYYQADPALLARHVERALSSIEKLGTLVSVDTNTINWVRATRGALAGKCVYVPNFVDLEDFHPEPRPESSSASVVALFPCRLQPPKGFWLLADILPEMLERRAELRFRFVGKPGEREKEAVEGFLARYPGRVSWDSLPPERMAEAYRDADIVLLPTVAAEGTSLSCLEAQACGKAVVATHVGGLADLIISEHNGLLIEPTAPALLAALDRLIEDRGLRERLGRNAAAAAWDFRLERWRESWAALLRSRLGAAGPATAARARRAPVTALFPAAGTSRDAARRVLWPLASELARRGIDTYWVEGDGSREPAHPRLHVLSEQDDLELSRPLRFDFQDGEVRISRASPDGEEKRIASAAGADSRAFWRTTLRPVLRAVLSERRHEAARSPQRAALRQRAESSAGPAESEDASRVRARQVEVESALARLRLEAAGERSRWRQELAELEERGFALADELQKAQRYVSGILAEREGTVSALNLRLAELENEKTTLARKSVEEQAARLAEAEKIRAAARESLAEREREAASLRREIEEREAAAVSLKERVASQNRRLSELQKEADEKAAALKEAQESFERLEEEYQGTAAESRERHGHLAYAMQELDRLRNTPMARLRRTASRWGNDLRHPKALFYRYSAQGTPLYQLGLRMMPKGFARWVRRAIAPHPPQQGPPPAPPPPKTDGGSLAARASGRYDVIVFSIIDWDFRFQRPQQIAAQFGRNGHRVFFLSTTDFIVGDREPWRLLSKAKGVSELRMRNRRALDVYGGRLEPDDLKTLEKGFESLARQYGIGDAVCLLEVPFWWPLAKRLRERFGWRVVYDCMDEWTNFPGFKDRVVSLEQDLVSTADVTVVSADRLQEKWEGGAKSLVLARNGVDLAHYREHFDENRLLGRLPHPIIGYYGALASWVDVPLIVKVARRHPEATIVLAGGHFDVDLSPVAELPNVRLLGQRPYEEMPGLLWNFDVCMIPFLVNDITEATNPVKFYEYLYGEKPVVAPDLSELRPFAGVSYLAKGHEEFLEQIDRALAESKDDPRRPERRAIAEANDWSVRYRAIDEAVCETYPVVSIVVVTFGGLELTKNCLDSLLEGETWPRLDVVVVDNASPDGTKDYLAEVAKKDPRVRCFFNSRNLGFAAANNVGIRHAGGDVVVLLNNDTVVPPGLIGRLVSHLQRDPSIGLLCPTTNFCGNEARIEPDYQEISGLPAFAARRARDFEGQNFDIPVAAMYCVASRASVLREVGPLDEAFGVGLFEDDDFSIRMREAGYRVACAQDAYVHHIGQGAFRLLSPTEYAAIWSRNQAYFESKWGKSWKPHTTRAGVAAPESNIAPEPASASRTGS